MVEVRLWYCPSPRVLLRKPFKDYSLLSCQVPILPRTFTALCVHVFSLFCPLHFINSATWNHLPPFQLLVLTRALLLAGTTIFSNFTWETPVWSLGHSVWEANILSIHWKHPIWYAALKQDFTIDKILSHILGHLIHITTEWKTQGRHSFMYQAYARSWQ